MARYFRPLLAAVLAGLAMLAWAAPSQARIAFPGGSWSQSCQNAYIDGSFLFAQCLDRRGRWRNAFLDLSQCPGTVSNADGQLVCDVADGGYPPVVGGSASLPQGNWVDVCQAADVQGGRMNAQCSDGRGRIMRSALMVSQCPANNVTVNRGQLRCEFGPVRYGQSLGLLPRGDWVNVCWAAQVDNGVMQAQCDDGRGRNVASALNLRTCPRYEATVQRGRLRCR